MSLPVVLKSITLLACLWWASSGLHSQTTTPIQSWEDSALAEIDLERQEIRKFDQTKDRWIKTPLPKGTWWATFCQGQYWALTKPAVLPLDPASEGKSSQEAESRPQQDLWRCDWGKPWERVATFKPDHGVANALAAFPLENDRFLLASKFHFSFVDGTYPLAIAKLNSVSGYLELERPEDLGLGGPYTKNLSATGKKITENESISRRNPNSIIYRNLTTESTPTMISIGDRPIIFSMYLGVIWIFDSHGNLRKKCVLYPEVKDEDYKNLFHFERAILGWQLTPEHKILLATRSIDAVLLARKSHPILYTDGSTYPLYALKAHNDWAAKDFPDIQWWEFDPETGDFHRTSVPPNFPNRLDQLANPDSQVLFTFTPEGIPVLRSPRAAPPEKPVKELPKVAPKVVSLNKPS